MATGNESVSREELDHALQQERERSRQEWEGKLEVWKHERKNELEEWKHDRQIDVENFRAVISQGSAALKTLLIINGGGAAVLLAFIGQVVTKDGLGSDVVSGVAPAMQFFLAGLLSCVFSYGCTYVSQFFYGHKWLKFGYFFQALAIGLFLVSAGAFAWGAWSATAVFVAGVAAL